MATDMRPTNDEVLDYVAAHECAHLLEMNHSPRFWAHVAHCCPDHKRLRKWLKDNGRELIDPDRTCIVGWSYGGYSALAGGAFTPEKYACVAAIAPVSDLPRTFRKIAREDSKSSFAYSYWSDLIGDPKTQKDLLKERSPVNYAENFKAPVLLIHGEDDEVVDVDQTSLWTAAARSYAC